MREKLNKHLYRAILIISFLAANALVIFGISSVFGFLNTGADRSAMLHTEIKSRRLYLPEVQWDTSAYRGRPMERQSLGEIERDYLNSWYVKNLAYQTNKTYGVEDYYTESARVNIYNTIHQNKSASIHFNSTTISHHPDLKFYSADGQLVVFNDENVIEYSESLINNETVDRKIDTASYRVMMLLEDGFWRVRHMVGKSSADFNKDFTKKTGDWKIAGTKILYKEKEYEVRGINYYPQANPWDLFGEAFDIEIINKDFKIIAESGLNTIRIFVPYEDFGKADLDPVKTKKLQQLLDAAHQNDLKAVVTLFDFYGDYSVMGWTLTHEHVRQLVGKFRNHPAILAWDIKNEPDLDFDSRGKKLVINWLKSVISQVKSADSNHFITIGWASPESAAILKDEVDLVSFHYYRDIEEFSKIAKDLKTKINKPLVLQEFGISSYNGFWNPLGANEKDQAAYYKQMHNILGQQEMGFLSWTLYDFEDVPSSVVGRLPWRKVRQKHFGFIDRSGRKKAAFKYISR